MISYFYPFSCSPSLLRRFWRAGLALFYLQSSAAALEPIGAAGLDHVKSFSAVFVPLMVVGVVLTLIVGFSAWILSIIIGSKD